MRGGNIDIVLAKSISRFARNTVDLLETVRHLKELGIEVQFEKGHISSLSDDGEPMGLLLLSAIRRLPDGKQYAALRPPCLQILVFCLLEYEPWTSSCFWAGETLLNPCYRFEQTCTQRAADSAVIQPVLRSNVRTSPRHFPFDLPMTVYLIPSASCAD